MAKTSLTVEDEKTMTTALKQAETEIDIDDMPLETIRDYRLYNEEARKRNKKLRMCRHPIKQCPVELHPTQRVKFANNDKSMNPVPVYLSNHLIHFEKKLIPGQTYDLPQCVVAYLADKGYPVWEWVTLSKDGAKETRVTGKAPRFSITTVYDQGDY